jgi:endonuclease/exonuclease/phosphatase family metal-dependent hydrolase
MKILTIAILFFFGWASATEPVHLRIVTWNLQWFPGGRTATKESQDRHIAAVREEIRKLNPEIIILQEVGSEGALNEALKPLDPKWSVSVISAFKQGNFISGQQIAIASKFPTISAWAEPWKRGWAEAPRGYTYALYSINGKKLAVYGVHLKSNIGNPPENTSKREDGISQMIDHINTDETRVIKPDAIVIGGDFNTDDPDSLHGQSKGERTFSFLKKAGFHWTFEGIDHHYRVTCPAKGRYSAASFDHIWTKNLGKPLASPKQSSASDHLPVVINITL